MPIRSRFVVGGTSKVCPVGFRNVGGQCVAIDEIGSKVSRRQVASASRQSTQPALLQMGIEQIERVRASKPPPLRDGGTAGYWYNTQTGQKQSGSPGTPPSRMTGWKWVTITGFAPVARVEPMAIRDLPLKIMADKRGSVQPLKAKDFCPSCERQAPKSTGVFDSRPPVSDLTPEDAERGSKNVVTGVVLVALAFAAKVAWF